MTIGDRLLRDQPDIYYRLLVEYDLAHKFLPPDRAKELYNLMMPAVYTGRVERKRGAVTQPHRRVIK